MKWTLITIFALALGFALMNWNRPNQRQFSLKDLEIRDSGQDHSKPSRRIPERTRNTRLWDSPLVKKGFIAGTGHTYHDFVSCLNLNEEETSYLMSLLHQRCTHRGMAEVKWKKAPPYARSGLLRKLRTELEANNALIRQFLNHEADFQFFLEYESELPERKALSPIQDVLALEPDQQQQLLNLLQDARLQTEKEFGYQFECALFLPQYEDPEMLRILREETDRKIISALPEILDSRQARLFQTNWKALRDEQLKHSEFTARVIREEDS